VTIYRVIKTGYGYEITGPGYWSPITDPEDIKDLDRWTSEADRIGADRASYIEYCITEYGWTGGGRS